MAARLTLAEFTLQPNISRALEAICSPNSQEHAAWFDQTFRAHCYGTAATEFDTYGFNIMRGDLQNAVASVCAMLETESLDGWACWWYDNRGRFAKVLKLAAYLEGKNAVDVLQFEPDESDVPYWLIRANKLLEKARTSGELHKFKEEAVAYVKSHRDDDVVCSYFEARTQKRVREIVETATATSPRSSNRAPATAV